MTETKMRKPQLKKKQSKMRCPKCGKKMKFDFFYDADAIEHDPGIYDGQYQFSCPRCASVVDFFRTLDGIGEK